MVPQNSSDEITSALGQHYAIVKNGLWNGVPAAGIEAWRHPKHRAIHANKEAAAGAWLGYPIGPRTAAAPAWNFKLPGATKYQLNDI